MKLDVIETELDTELDWLSNQSIDSPLSATDIDDRARRLLQLGEYVLEQWVVARGDEPTDRSHEGFRLLGLHRQGVKGEPSFNACRETCREVAYHFNILTTVPQGEKGAAARQQLLMMSMLVRHLHLFVSGKLIDAGLGDFCCASRPIRSDDAAVPVTSPVR